MMTTGLDAIREALRTNGYDVSRSSTDERLVVAVADDGDEDPDAEAALEEIRIIAKPFGGYADWTGDSDSWGDGSNTSDIGITISGAS